MPRLGVWRVNMCLGIICGTATITPGYMQPNDIYLKCADSMSVCVLFFSVWLGPFSTKV